MSAATNAEIGAILGGMITFDQSISNHLMDSHLDDAITWAKRFRKLYDAVQEHNRDTYVADVLWGMGYHRDIVEDKIEHYESMKMTGRA